jgi:hypothetical protein
MVETKKKKTRTKRRVIMMAHFFDYDTKREK